MRYIKPDYYDDFCCTADQCPDTCCAGWQIIIDDESLERYAEVQGDFGKRLRRNIDWQEGAFYQDHRRCAFLNEQNLCDLYTALGSEALCDTCRKYPRHVEEYEGLREWSLSLSCPVAAEIILSQQGFPTFITEEDEEPDELEEEFEDFDLLLFTLLEDARNAVFQRLHRNAEDPAKDFVQKNMKQALLLAGQMQACLEEGHFFEIEELIREYQEQRSEGDALTKPEDQYQKRLDLYHIMYGLERLRPEWTVVLEEMHQALYAEGKERYDRIRQEFERYMDEDSVRRFHWENTGLQLFVFFLYTYFCGGVYDDWIYSKMALAVHSVEFIRELFMARWKETGRLHLKDYVELSYRYAREIEHSDQNLNELENCFSEKWNFFQEGIDN